MCNTSVIGKRKLLNMILLEPSSSKEPMLKNGESHYPYFPDFSVGGSRASPLSVVARPSSSEDPGRRLLIEFGPAKYGVPSNQMRLLTVFTPILIPSVNIYWKHPLIASSSRESIASEHDRGNLSVPKCIDKRIQGLFGDTTAKMRPCSKDS